MYLDRKLIKSQAKELIKGKVMKLFLTAFILELCLTIVPIINTATSSNQIKDFINAPEDYFDFDDAFNFEHSFDFDDDFNNYQFDDDDDYNPYEDDFENFGTDNESGKSDFYNFGASFTPTAVTTANTMLNNQVRSVTLSYLGLIIQLLLIPLLITLTYYFVLLIRGKEFSGIDGIKFIFKEAFTNNYIKKIGVYLLKSIIMSGLTFVCLFPMMFVAALILAPLTMMVSEYAIPFIMLAVLFIVLLIAMIPAFVFHYSSYFAFQIMCDNPHFSPWQAIKISKKIIKGNRTELFILDLSFIPWMLLSVFLFPLIYVIPYVNTTEALYYENFRIRAMKQGRITEDDFLTDMQRMQKYSSQNTGTYQREANQQQGYAQASPNQYANNAGYYTQPQNNAYTAYQQNNTDFSQQANTAQNTYTTPEQNAPQQNNTYSAAPENTYAQPNTFVQPEAEEVKAEAKAQPAEHAETKEEIKPSEKYTPVTPPSEEYNATEDTAAKE